MTSEHDNRACDAIFPRYGQPQCESVLRGRLTIECRFVLRSSLLDRVKLCSIGLSRRQESHETLAVRSSIHECAIHATV